MAIKYIFLDFDGTISDSKKAAIESLKKTFKDFGFRYDNDKAGGLLGERFQVILDGLGLHSKDAKKVWKIFDKYFLEYAKKGKIKPCVDLKPLFELSKKYPLVIISNSNRAFLRQSMKALKIKKYFKAYYGCEDFPSKDIMIKKLYKKYKVKPNEVMFVGDRFSDIKNGKKAKCITVAISNKCAWSSKKEILKEGPDYIINNFKDLASIVEKKH